MKPANTLHPIASCVGATSLGTQLYLLVLVLAVFGGSRLQAQEFEAVYLDGRILAIDSFGLTGETVQVQAKGSNTQVERSELQSIRRRNADRAKPRPGFA